jgi:UDP-N-acetyl-D-mannosaminuronic acid dehydrogenase
MSTVCVHGLGYIGLPTAAMLANYGHDVTGYDTNEEVITQLQEGEIHIDEPGLRAFVTQAFESGNLEVTTEVPEAKYHIICVPTPFDTEAKQADLAYIEAAGEAIKPYLRTGDTVILESTVPPGTTNDVLRPMLEDTGLAAGADFALAHCPETVLPGDIISEMRQNARIIGGVNGVSTEAAVRLYESFVEGEIRTTANATTAEFVKLIQNTYRDANIAIANEIAKLAHDHEIDSREAIALANKHPRVEIHQPGPGVGGHCLPVDPWFLGQNTEQLDLIKHAREVNDGMSDYTIDILDKELDGLADARIAILGVAYKGNVGDTRESPGLKLARELQEAVPQTAEAPLTDGGSQISPVDVTLHDPHVNDQTLQLLPLQDAVEDTSAVVIATDHDEFENLSPQRFIDWMDGNLIVDSKATLDENQWKTEGFSIHRI